MTSSGAEGLSDEGHHVVRRLVNASSDAVWDVLADGWLYATWVVGASRLRDVDVSWPARGSRLHHSFGIWPAVIDDHTEVLHTDPGHQLVLRAKGWPVGEAVVEIRLRAVGDDHCEVAMLEDAVSGPGLVLPKVLRQPLMAVRNREALHRLGLLAEGRSVGVSSEDTSE
ncbi:MAG: SRPBCC family protein [Actinomycetota bacterium]|nr:SRPBCC family protein [Actinomycetota bacterium]